MENTIFSVCLYMLPESLNLRNWNARIMGTVLFTLIAREDFLSFRSFRAEVFIYAGPTVQQ